MILHTFGHEIEDIKKLYQKFRDDPMIARDMPPIAGKIMWSRQLFRKIEEPMIVFMDNAPELLKVNTINWAVSSGLNPFQLNAPKFLTISYILHSVSNVID